MSTQAPAAPGASPSNAGEPQSLPDPSKVRKGEAAPPRQIKPIKTKVELPGVDTGFNPKSPFDAKLAKALGRDSETGEPGTSVEVGDGPQFGDTPEARTKADTPKPQRGSDGKFQKAEGAEGAETGTETGAEGENAGENAEETVEGEGVETPPPPADETYEALLPKYRMLEQRHRTLQGMYGPIQLKATEAIRSQHAAAKSAVAWKAEAETLRARLSEMEAKLGGGGAGLPASGGGSQEMPTVSLPGMGSRIQAILKDIDWKMYGAVREQGEDAAAAWVVAQVLDIADKDRKSDIDKLREEIGQIRQPIEERQHRNSVARTAVEVFGRVADMKAPSGEYLFPELYDPAKAEEVGHTWRQLKFDPSVLLTPAGVVQAILAYRFYKGEAPPPPTAGGEGTNGNGEEEGEEGEVADEAGDAARSLRALAGSRASSPRRSDGAERDPAFAVKRALRDTVVTDDEFGFPTRRSNARRLRGQP